jgi:zinc transport system substrate-binding protein
MRTTIILSIVAGLAVGLLGTGCGGSSAHSSSGKRTVAASFYPLAFAAQQVGGAGVEVENLTPTGAEPHDLEVSPKDVTRLRDADLVLLLGRDFQPQLEEAAGGGERVIRVLDTPALGVHANGDPHVWLDPLRFAVVVRRIGEALGMPRRAATLIARLGRLDQTYRDGLSDCSRHEIVTSHEAFAYLAERYSLRQIAITGLSPEAEPTPRELERVVGLVGRTGATTIFFETLVSPRIAETVARETGARTAVLNPIEGLTPAQADAGDDYFSLMRANLAALRSALGCR